VTEGDVFFLETGLNWCTMVRLLIAEISKPLIYYRLYDFDRMDVHGNKRELHVDLAFDANNYIKVSSRMNYLKEENVSNSVVNCPYFTTNFPLTEATTNGKQGNTLPFTCV
jgi:mannose-6-phosphate isomerase